MGCKKCYDRRRGDSVRTGTQNFIEKAKSVHGNKYDYSQVEYQNNKTPVTIICPKHGPFSCRPDKHTSRKSGCPKCAAELNGLNKRSTTEEFITRALKVHGDKYDYSKVDYQGCDKPVIIICRKHGEFLQSPYAHLHGAGCPICHESHLENEISLSLSNQNIKFIQQKRFEWLGRMSLDFYIEEGNVAIECQGLQHFRAIYSNKMTDEDKRKMFAIISERDKRKNTLCKEHGITLLYYTREKFLENSNLNTIYEKNNTFCDSEEICEKVKNLSITIFESIVNATLK